MTQQLSAKTSRDEEAAKKAATFSKTITPVAPVGPPLAPLKAQTTSSSDVKSSATTDAKTPINEFSAIKAATATKFDEAAKDFKTAFQLPVPGDGSNAKLRPAPFSKVVVAPSLAPVPPPAPKVVAAPVPAPAPIAPKVEAAKPVPPPAPKVVAAPVPAPPPTFQG